MKGRADMRRIRRSSMELRVELTPLVDVVFLLLTFFLFSLAVMVRADVLDISLPGLGAAEAASERSPLVIAVHAQGGVTIGGETMTSVQACARAAEARTRDPSTPVVVAADVGAPASALLEVIDGLSKGGIRDFGIMGAPGAAGGAAPGGE